jgi:hypothetical protein
MHEIFELYLPGSSLLRELITPHAADHVLQLPWSPQPRLEHCRIQSAGVAITKLVPDTPAYYGDTEITFLLYRL